MRTLVESVRRATREGSLTEVLRLLELVAYKMQQGPRGGWFYYTPNEKKVYRHLRRGGSGAHKATGQDFDKAWADRGEAGVGEALKEIFGDKAPDPAQLERMLSAPGINAKIQHVAVGYGNSVTVQFSATQRDGQRIDKRLIRSFSKDGRGPHVHHDYFTMDEAMQGGGRGGAMLASSIKEYKKMGIKTISVSAALEAGPYTWLRFGFKPEYPEDIVDGFESFLLRTPDRGGVGLPSADVQALMKKAGGDPRKLSMIKIKGTNKDTGKPEVLELGKDYLLHGRGGGSVGWSGEVDMADKTQVSHFEAQAQKGLKKRKAAMAKGTDNEVIKPEVLAKRRAAYQEKRTRYSIHNQGTPKVAPVSPVRLARGRASE